MVKILFVCHGNICRSPMAELVFKKMIELLGISNDFYVESKGTSNEEEGNPVSQCPAAERAFFLGRYGAFPSGAVYFDALSNLSYGAFERVRLKSSEAYVLCG